MNSDTNFVTKPELARRLAYPSNAIRWMADDSIAFPKICTVNGRIFLDLRH